MKALIFDKSGLENLKLKEIDKPEPGPHEALIRVKMAGVNPIDYRVVTSMKVTPMPHIPGAEISGIVEEVGERVTRTKPGERIVVYGKIFDETCDLCLSGKETICRNGGILGVVTNGGFAEYVSLPEKNVFRIPDWMSWEIAASVPVAALTPYHALREAGLRLGEFVVVVGASGNTGTFAVQFAKKAGAKVIAVSRKEWLKDFGADYVVRPEEMVEKVGEITGGNMADVVVNSIGVEMWEKSFSVVGPGGRYVTFGALTGGEVKLNLSSFYNKHIKLLGTTGGSREELLEVMEVCKDCKVKLWKVFGLEEGRKALESLSARDRDGRIFIKVS